MMASDSRVARASCTLGSSIRGPTVSTNRSVSNTTWCAQTAVVLAATPIAVRMISSVTNVRRTRRLGFSPSIRYPQFEQYLTPSLFMTWQFGHFIAWAPLDACAPGWRTRGAAASSQGDGVRRTRQS